MPQHRAGRLAARTGAQGERVLVEVRQREPLQPVHVHSRHDAAGRPVAPERRNQGRRARVHHVGQRHAHRQRRVEGRPARARRHQDREEDDVRRRLHRGAGRTRQAELPHGTLRRVSQARSDGRPRPHAEGRRFPGALGQRQRRDAVRQDPRDDAAQLAERVDRRREDRHRGLPAAAEQFPGRQDRAARGCRRARHHRPGPEGRRRSDDSELLARAGGGLPDAGAEQSLDAHAARAIRC